MANDFDQLPVYDPITEQGSNNISDVWVGAFSYFIQNLVGYLTQNGILLPQITTAQRDQITHPQNGQIIYNTTVDSAQYYKAGTWTSI